MKFLSVLMLGMMMCLGSCGRDEKQKEPTGCSSCECKSCECSEDGVCGCSDCECSCDCDGDGHDDSGDDDGGCPGGVCPDPEGN